MKPIILLITLMSVGCATAETQREHATYGDLTIECAKRPETRQQQKALFVASASVNSANELLKMKSGFISPAMQEGLKKERDAALHEFEATCSSIR
jgi:hypothetical protein